MIKKPLEHFLKLVAFFLAIPQAFAAHPTILQPKGLIAFQERKIIFDTAALMLIVVIPVIIMSFAFVYKYRRGKSVTEYKPDWHHSTFLEVLWWGVPFAIVFILAIITWVTTHKLDPFRKLNYPGKVEQIQVIALPWKWLFIYPEHGITTVNKLVLPLKRQAEFTLTNDNVPMSAFFIPQLGSQIYSMAGMETKLHLVPTETAHIEGFNSQFNGYGFSDMRFNVDVVSLQDYKAWLENIKRNNKPFSQKAYNKVRQPSHEKAKEQEYSSYLPKLFNHVVHSYMLAQHPKGEI